MKIDSNCESQTAKSRFLLPTMIAAASLFSIAVATVTLAQQFNDSENASIWVKNDAPAKKGNRPGRPPKEALNACKSKVENMSCNFNDTRRSTEIEGTCRQVTQGVTACVPNDASLPPKA